MVNYKLIYFDMRGLGEPIRLLLRYVGEEFEDFRHDFESFKQYKPMTKYGHIPVLELSDGRKLYEALAIITYLGKKFGLAGKDDFEEAQVLEISSFYREIADEIKGYVRTFVPILKFEEGEQKIQKQKATDVIIQKLPIVEKILDESGSGYLLKSGITTIDFFLVEFVTTLINILPEVIKKFPKLNEYRDRIYNNPKLQKYIESRKETTL